MKIGFVAPGFFTGELASGVAVLHTKVRSLFDGFLKSKHDVHLICYQWDIKYAIDNNIPYTLLSDMKDANFDVAFIPDLYIVRVLNERNESSLISAKIIGAAYDGGFPPNKFHDDEFSKRLNFLFTPSEYDAMNGRSCRPETDVVPIGHGLPIIPTILTNPYSSEKNILYAGRFMNDINEYLNNIASSLSEYTIWLIGRKPFGNEDKHLGFTDDEFRRIFPNENIKLVAKHLGLSYEKDDRYGPLAFDEWWSWARYADCCLGIVIPGNPFHVFSKSLSYWGAGGVVVLPNNHMNVIYIRNFNGKVHATDLGMPHILNVIKEAAEMKRDHNFIASWAQSMFSWSDVIAPKIIYALEQGFKAKNIEDKQV